MNKLVNLILLLFVICNYGQEKNKEYLELKTNLLHSKTELVIAVHTNCFGGEFIDKEAAENCEYEIPFYLFWIKDGKYYKRKFSNCEVFTEVALDKSEFIEKVKSNLTAIQEAEILPVKHEKEYPNGEVEIYELEIEPYCELKLMIHSEKGQIMKKIIDYQLTTEFIEDNIPNDNYLKNQKSILKNIYKLAEIETLY